MKVNSVSGINFSFKSTPTAKNPIKRDENPVSKAGEKAVLAKAGFFAGLGFGAKLLWELMDGDFIFEDLNKASKKIVSKQKNLSQTEYIVKRIGVSAGLIGMFIGAAALLYTLFKAPEINYNGNVNAFKNKKDMDVYIKGNNVEKELYSQMNDRALTADSTEKAKLREQYMQMRLAKNQVPDFVYRR